MSDTYTPDTDAVVLRYIHAREQDGVDPAESTGEITRWISEKERLAKSRAWEECVKAHEFARGTTIPVNPYSGSS